MNPTSPATGNPAAPAPFNRPMITVSIMLATLMQTLDSTIANVALPHMQGALSASQDEITWVLTSYIVAAAIATPLTGWLSARYGIKRLMAVAVTGFTIASVLCGIAETLSQIVSARLLQGVFGAALVPLSQSILLEINPRHRHGQAMAIFGVGVMVGPILGPTLGGWLTESYNWRWVFFINVPVGIVALLGTLAYLPETGRQHGRALDFFGFAMLSLTVGALQALLDRGEKLDWFASTEIRLEAIVAAIGFLFFVVHTATARGRSFLPAALLKDRNFITCSSFIFLIGAVMYATRALLPPMLQSLMNYPVMTTGLVTAPSGAGTMLAMLLAGRFVGRIDVRAMLIAGFAVSAWSLWQMMHYTTVLSESDIVWPGLIQGVGLGFVFVPLSSMAFSTLPSTVRADGTAFYSLMRNIGSSIGISVIEASAARNTQIAHASLAEHLSVFDPIVREQVDVHSLAALARLNELVTQQANMIAYVDAFKLMFVATLAVLPLALIIRTTKHHGSAGETHLVID